jgi:hypothetical protein
VRDARLGSTPLCFFQFFAQFDYDLLKIKSDHQKSLVLELLRRINAGALEMYLSVIIIKH